MKCRVFNVIMLVKLEVEALRNKRIGLLQYDQVVKLCSLSFRVLPPVALTPQL